MDRRCSGVRQLGPAVFVIGLDGGLVLCECQTDTDVAIQMAIRHVMSELAYRPAAGPVRCVELLVAQVGHDRPQLCRGRRDLVDPLTAPLVRSVAVVLKPADWIS